MRYNAYLNKTHLTLSNGCVIITLVIILDLYNETKSILKRYNIRADKGLGQNFLVDEEVIEKIISSSGITKEDLVIEIGPGLGVLTKPLLEAAGKVICIEIDKRMIAILEDRFSLYDNLEIINDDILKVDLRGIIEEEKKEKISCVKVVANLPYYITTPIIMKLLEDKLDISTITVMVQKEVADRLVEKPGGKESGAITYAINYYTIPGKVLDVPKESFLPEPEVNSTVIRLDVRSTPAVEVISEETLFKVIKLSFMQKRKTLLNGLANSNLLGDKPKIEKMLQDVGFDINIRGEKLTLEDFAKIADYIEKR